VVSWPKRTLGFNAILSCESWRASEEIAAALSRYRSEIESRVDFYFLVKKASQEWFPGFTKQDLKRIQTPERLMSLCELLRDPSLIRNIARAIAVPHSEILDETWLKFRQLQVMLQHALILLFQYGEQDIQASSETLEHDICDLDYLMLGLHSRRLATRESTERIGKMGWRFKVLLPDGELIAR
jgi:hypothetical protein